MFSLLKMATTEKLLSELESQPYPQGQRDARRHVHFTTENGAKNGICDIIHTAQEEEEDMLTFTCHVISALHQTAFGHVIWILSILMSLAALVIGILRFNSCPCERTIPLFLTVGSVILLLKGLLSGLQKCCRRKPVEERQSLYTVNDILTTLIVFWTMTGTVWVFGALPKVQTITPDLPEFCDKLLYWSSFTMVCIYILAILCWSLLSISLCIFYNYNDSTPSYSCFDDACDNPMDDKPVKISKPSLVLVIDTGNHI